LTHVSSSRIEVTGLSTHRVTQKLDEKSNSSSGEDDLSKHFPSKIFTRIKNLMRLRRTESLQGSSAGALRPCRSRRRAAAICHICSTDFRPLNFRDKSEKGDLCKYTSRPAGVSLQNIWYRLVTNHARTLHLTVHILVSRFPL
jgi:hypothetical protein